MRLASNIQQDLTFRFVKEKCKGNLLRIIGGLKRGLGGTWKVLHTLNIFKVIS